jgi:hypothetical protein
MARILKLLSKNSNPQQRNHELQYYLLRIESMLAQTYNSYPTKNSNIFDKNQLEISKTFSY